jgi:probable rRNA maturation factor
MLDAGDVAAALAAPAGDILLGDIALAFETCVAEAADKSIALADHASHLIVHGTLHLLGHDHANDATAAAMEALETRILAGLGLADPYALADSYARADPYSLPQSRTLESPDA